MSFSAFLDLMVSSESGTSSSDEGAEFMGLQSAIALSLQERYIYTELATVAEKGHPLRVATNA